MVGRGAFVGIPQRNPIDWVDIHPVELEVSDKPNDGGKAMGFQIPDEVVEAVAEAHFLEARIAEVDRELRDAPPANYEEDNYEAGYIAGLEFALDALRADA